jgi:16S rRNA A1518/A1519 N6-dimethyltransferase RsmA/KsgA/DIM1 with predicted DNA glycosylase/AP lyase activity
MTSGPLAAAGIDETLRAENLPPEAYVNLAALAGVKE